MDTLHPIRRIPISHWANTGYLPSSKVSGGIAKYESRVERDFYILLNHEPTVIQYQFQPEVIRWVDNKGKERRYTPDVLVITRLGRRILCEIKTEAEIDENLKDYKEPWVAADNVTKQRGWDFLIFTDQMIRTARFYNVWFCWGAARARFQEKDSDLEKLMDFIKDFNDGIEYKQLCEELARFIGLRIDKAALVVCYAIYHGLVWVDTFSSTPIDANTIIRPLTRLTTCFRPIFDEIKAYSVHDLIANENGLSGLKVSEDVLERRFPQLSPKYEKIVEQRESIVKQWLAVPLQNRNAEWRERFEKQSGVSQRTIESWVQRFEAGGIEGLVPRFEKAGRPRSTSSDVVELMEEYRRRFLKERLSTLKGIHSELVSACETRHLIPPNYLMFQRYVKKSLASEIIKAKKGRTAWRQRFRPSISIFKDAIMPLQVIEVDNTSLDVFPVDSAEWNAIHTPYLIGAIDVYTKMITGYYLTFDHPSSLTALEVIVMTMLSKNDKITWRNTVNSWPIEGIPVLVLVDNGMDFRAEDVRKFCVKHGIILEFAPVKTPEYKASIEQWFEILKKGLKNESMPGFRPSLQQRKDMPEYNPENSAALTRTEIERWLVSWIVDSYHERLQQKDHVPSPLMMFDEAIKGRTPYPLPAPINLTIKEQDVIEYFSLNELHGQLTNKGITKAYIQYNSTEMQSLLRKRGPGEIEYRFDPRDIRTIFVIHPDTGKVINAHPSSGWTRTLIDASGDAPISESEWKLILKQARERNRKRISPSTLRQAEGTRRQETMDASQRTAQSKKKTKKERLAGEIKKEHAMTALSARKNVDTRKKPELIEPIQELIEDDDHYVPKKIITQVGQSSDEGKDHYKPKKHAFELLNKKGENHD